MSQSQIDPTLNTEHLTHSMLKATATLILCGLLTGLYISLVAMKVVTADLSVVLSSHLNALLGAFWIAIVAYSLKFCHLSDAKRTWMIRSIVLANFANWFITLIKAHLHVAGIELTQDMTNNFIMIALTLFVVLPALVGSILWIQGLNKKG